MSVRRCADADCPELVPVGHRLCLGCAEALIPHRRELEAALRRKLHAVADVRRRQAHRGSRRLGAAA